MRLNRLVIIGLFLSVCVRADPAVRGEFLYFLHDPDLAGQEEMSYRHLQDGILVMRDGKILELDDAKEVLARHPNGLRLKTYPHSIILPGFIDTHVHYPQTEIIASYGEQLLEWLNQYTFPAERQFQDSKHATEVASFFLSELLRNGTTTALVFSTVHRTSVDALFEGANKLGMRIISGKVLMDRNAPPYLLDNPESSYEDSKALIQKWQGKGRLLYAISPRFAPTSSDEEMQVVGRLKKEFPDVYIQTHLAENKKEGEWVKSLFPKIASYLGVYEKYGFLGKKSIFAHSIYLSSDEFKRLSDSGSSVAFCPTSNLFLGSGLFDLSKAEAARVNFGLGTDIGAGTSFSMLQTLNEAYKVAQLQGQRLSPLKAFYLATLGGAQALSLEDKVGSLAPGHEADFVVLNFNSTPLLRRRLQDSRSLEDRLFALMMLGDDRNVTSTYIAGSSKYEGPSK